MRSNRAERRRDRRVRPRTAMPRELVEQKNKKNLYTTRRTFCNRGRIAAVTYLIGFRREKVIRRYRVMNVEKLAIKNNMSNDACVHERRSVRESHADDVDVGS